MKAVLYSNFGEMRFIDDAPRPEPRSGEALVRVSHVGICGSELEGFVKRSPRRKPPLILGHEFSGTVLEVNGGDEVKVGDTVAANPLVVCGQCELCLRGLTSICPNRELLSMHRPGAFAEYVCVPTRNLHQVDESALMRAAFVEPCANAVHVLRLAQTPTPRLVAVMGAGTIGGLCAQVARLVGAPELLIVDVSDFRLDLAVKAGHADRAVNARDTDVLGAAREFTKGRGFDVVIDAVGMEVTRRQSVEMLAPGGTAVWIGTYHDDTSIGGMGIVSNERCVKGSYGFSEADFQKAVGLMTRGKIEVESWTREFPLAEGADVFYRLLKGETSYIKALLRP